MSIFSLLTLLIQSKKPLQYLFNTTIVVQIKINKEKNKIIKFYYKIINKVYIII